MIGDAVVGALTLSTLAAERTWRDELVQRLRLFGEVFANSLSRKQSELEAQGLRQRSRPRRARLDDRGADRVAGS